MNIVHVCRHLASKQVLRQPLFKVIVFDFHDTNALGHASDLTSQDKFETVVGEYTFVIQGAINVHLHIGQKLVHRLEHQCNEMEALCLVLALSWEQRVVKAAENPGQHSHKDLEIARWDVLDDLDVLHLGWEKDWRHI